MRLHAHHRAPVGTPPPPRLNPHPPARRYRLSDSEASALLRALERGHDAAAKHLAEEHRALAEVEAGGRAGADTEAGQDYEAKRKVGSRDGGWLQMHPLCPCPTCAVLCCAVLCCAVLCCAVLCCAVLCCAVLCCAVLAWALRCIALPPPPRPLPPDAAPHRRCWQGFEALFRATTSLAEALGREAPSFAEDSFTRLGAGAGGAGAAGGAGPQEPGPEQVRGWGGGGRGQE